jgi:hypothetical protein
MARRAGSDQQVGEWVKSFGEQLGAELGRVIADSLERTLRSSIDLNEMARRLGGSTSGRRGRSASGQKALCSEPGCPNAVLAKGLCRSHYYRARYRAQKAGTLGKGAGRGRKASKKRRGRAKGPAASPAPTETAAS